MGLFVKDLILSVILAISCKEYYETILPKRDRKQDWISETSIFAFVLGFMVISETPIPPYIFMPVRVIFIIWIIAQIYYKTKWINNLILSVLFCGIIWILSSIVISVLYLLSVDSKVAEYILDPVWCSILLLIMSLFSYRFKGQMDILKKGKRFHYVLISGIFSVFCIALLMIISTWDENPANYSIRFIFVIGFGITSILMFYFICNILIKDMHIQNMQIETALINNQMSMYQNMEQNYRRQQKYMHDYKNQLNCIQGLLEKRQVEEVLDYIGELTGEIRKSTDYVDTSHVIINVILNQKYQYAQENGITMIMNVNDLSHLTMKKEDIVVLLSNLLDNAIEACKSLSADKVIQFKMVMEEGSLILSVRNPVSKPFKIKDGRIISSKKDRENHGIGLRNVENVVKRNHGTSSVKCEDHCFSFSCMIPV